MIININYFLLICTEYIILWWRLLVGLLRLKLVGSEVICKFISHSRFLGKLLKEKSVLCLGKRNFNILKSYLHYCVTKLMWRFYRILQSVVSFCVVLITLKETCGGKAESFETKLKKLKTWYNLLKGSDLSLDYAFHCLRYDDSYLSNPIFILIIIHCPLESTKICEYVKGGWAMTHSKW